MAAKVHRLQSQTAQALGPKNWGRTLLRSHLLCCQSRPKTGSGNPDREPAALLNNHGDAGVKVNKSTPAGTGHRRRWRVDRPPSPCGWGWGGGAGEALHLSFPPSDFRSGGQGRCRACLGVSPWVVLCCVGAVPHSVPFRGRDNRAVRQDSALPVAGSVCPGSLASMHAATPYC